MFATPIGYLIDADGIIVKDVAQGNEAILALADDLATDGTTKGSLWGSPSHETVVRGSTCEPRSSAWTAAWPDRSSPADSTGSRAARTRRRSRSTWPLCRPCLPGSRAGGCTACH